MIPNIPAIPKAAYLFWRCDLIAAFTNVFGISGPIPLTPTKLILSLYANHDAMISQNFRNLILPSDYDSGDLVMTLLSEWWIKLTRRFDLILTGPGIVYAAEQLCENRYVNEWDKASSELAALLKLEAIRFAEDRYPDISKVYFDMNRHFDEKFSIIDFYYVIGLSVLSTHSRWDSVISIVQYANEASEKWVPLFKLMDTIHSRFISTRPKADANGVAAIDQLNCFNLKTQRDLNIHY